MPYPAKNNSTYTSPSKNSSTSTNEEESGQFCLLIDDTFFFLVESTYKLLIEPIGSSWSYQTKS